MNFVNQRRANNEPQNKEFRVMKQGFECRLMIEELRFEMYYHFLNLKTCPTSGGSLFFNRKSARPLTFISGQISEEV